MKHFLIIKKIRAQGKAEFDVFKYEFWDYTSNPTWKE